MRYDVRIDGMLSVHAKHAVFTALSAVEGLLHAEIELGRAELTHDGRATEAAIREAVQSAGFTVRAIKALPRALPQI